MIVLEDMPCDPHPVFVDVRLLLWLLFVLSQWDSVATTADQLGLLPSQNPPTYFALVELHRLEEQVNSMPEYIRDELVCTLLYAEEIS